MRKTRLLTLLVLLLTAATGAWATDVITVTWSSGDTYENNNSKDGVTLSGDIVEYYDDEWKLAYGESKGTFTTELGNFTKIEITGGYVNGFSGEGWSGRTWTGNAAAVPFGGYITDDSGDQPWTITFTIEPASSAPAGYTVSMKDGVKDADKWTITPNPAEEGQTVTLQYNGRLKVKGVKATSDAAAAEPAAIINGKFSVSDTKQVYFSKGNLRYVSGAWSFFDNQYDYYATYSADAWDKFGWSNSTNDFGKSTSTNNNDYKNDLVDWGTVPGIGSGWRTLTLAEWQYLFSTRSASTVNSVANARYAKGKVNNVYGIILFPDTYTHPDGVTNPVGINDTGNTGWNGNNYNATDWGKMEAAGCVFLPAAGYRQGTSVSSCGSSCSYRSSTRYSPSMVQYIYFESSLLNLETHNVGYYGQCVRLVREVTE